MKIYSTRNGSLSADECLELAKLLIKAGYTVRVGKEKLPGKSTALYYVEFMEKSRNE